MRLPRYIHPYGRNALLLEWEQRISPEINRSVHAFAEALRRHPSVTECVPGYASLLLSFTGSAKTAYALRESIFSTRPEETPLASPYVHTLPVCYGGGFGPDLPDVCALTGLTETEVITTHTSTEYLVYLLGFHPGFAFMGEVEARLEVSRRKAPRTNLPRGSVGLAGRQTGIYPDASPGGWQLIGQCPLPLLDDRTGETRFRAGDRVRFRKISEPEFIHLQSAPPPWPIR